MFIELTEHNTKKKVAINVDRIIRIEDEENGCSLHLPGRYDYIHVNEDYKQVLHLVRNPSSQGNG